MKIYKLIPIDNICFNFEKKDKKKKEDLILEILIKYHLLQFTKKTWVNHVGISHITLYFSLNRLCYIISYIYILHIWNKIVLNILFYFIILN